MMPDDDLVGTTCHCNDTHVQTTCSVQDSMREVCMQYGGGVHTVLGTVADPGGGLGGLKTPPSLRLNYE